jgi:tannase
MPLSIIAMSQWLTVTMAGTIKFSTGGFAPAINAGKGNASGGVQYGAIAGTTDGGFGSFSTTFDGVFLLANHTINY